MLTLHNAISVSHIPDAAALSFLSITLAVVLTTPCSSFSLAGLSFALGVGRGDNSLKGGQPPRFVSSGHSAEENLRRRVFIQ